MRFLPALILATLMAAPAAFGQSCNRECLSGFITRYLDAMVAHDPSRVPVDTNIRVTEDSKETTLGEGLWKTASKLRDFRQDIIDVREGVAASQVIVEEAGNPIMLALRLKIDNQKIAEVETLVTRSRAEGALFNMDGLQKPRGGLTALVPAAERNTREEMIRIANYYPRGLTVGSFVEVDAPFAEGAYRIENGGTMAGPGCTREGCENIKTQRIIKHPDLTSDVVAADEEQGVVLLWMNFGDTNSYGPGNALIVYEAFKVYGGQIHAVEAFMKVLPAATKRGWD